VPVAEASYPGRNGLIAFSRVGPNLNSPETIWLVDPRSGRTRPLTRARRFSSWEDYSPSFSPSGRFVAYVHSDDCDGDGLYVIRVDGRERRRVLHDLTADIPVFSPSATRLAFDSGDGETAIMELKDPGSRRELVLSRRSRYFTASPAWAVTGRLAIVVGGDDRGLGHIATVRPNGTGLHLVTRSARDASPDWSPTAGRIAFERDKPNSGDYISDILVAPARAQRHARPRRITHTRDAFFPVWSPDGRNIAFPRARIDDATASLYIARARDGERLRVVARHLDPVGRISWQPRPRH
jgi:Tol biopolymer transport system component